MKTAIVRVGAEDGSGSVAIPLLTAFALGGTAMLFWAKPIYGLLGAIGGYFVGRGLNKETSSSTSVAGAHVGQLFSKAIAQPAPFISGPYGHLILESQTGVVEQIKAIVRDWYKKPTSWLYWADYLQHLHDSLAISHLSPAALSEIKKVEIIMRTGGEDRATLLEPYLYPIGCVA